MDGDSTQLKLVDAIEGIDHHYREVADLLRSVGLDRAAATVDRSRRTINNTLTDWLTDVTVEANGDGEVR